VKASINGTPVNYGLYFRIDRLESVIFRDENDTMSFEKITKKSISQIATAIGRHKPSFKLAIDMGMQEGRKIPPNMQKPRTIPIGDRLK